MIEGTRAVLALKVRKVEGTGERKIGRNGPMIYQVMEFEMK